MHGGPGYGALRRETGLPLTTDRGRGVPGQPHQRARRSPRDWLRLRVGLGRPLRPVPERSPGGAGAGRPWLGARARSGEREDSTHPRPLPGAPVRAGLHWFQETPDTERLFAVRWDGEAYRVVVPEQVGTASSLTYQPSAGVVAEFHSHGKGRSFFSATDDKDEQGFHIYGVVGRLDAAQPEMNLRLGIYGHFAPLGWPQVFGGPDPYGDDHESEANHTKEGI